MLPLQMSQKYFLVYDLRSKNLADSHRLAQYFFILADTCWRSSASMDFRPRLADRVGVGR